MKQVALILLTLQLLLFTWTSRAFDAKREALPALFLDCDFCDHVFFRQEISYVNFVRDRYLADIYIMLTENVLGSGASEYKLFLVGQNTFEGRNDTLSFQTKPNAAESDIRNGMLSLLKKGLLKYLVNTDLIHHINYDVVNLNEDFNPESVRDKWNFWTVSLSSRLNGDRNSYQNNMSMHYGLIANRTTSVFKTETGISYGFNRQKYRINDSTLVTGLQSRTGGYHFMAFSVGRRLAMGHFGTYFQNTQQNLENSFSYLPALEYNFFGYEEASRRQLRLIYRAGVRYQNYYEKTIYDRMDEWVYPHSLVIQWVQIEKWGTVNLAAGAWHYLNHPDMFNTSLYPSINFNPLSGLRIGFWGDISMINDQFYIRKADASVNEILLNQVELKTDYFLSYGFSINYTFGSKYNNVINVRFDLNDNFW